jgi:hypothetical protein
MVGGMCICVCLIKTLCASMVGGMYICVCCTQTLTVCRSCVQFFPSVIGLLMATRIFLIPKLFAREEIEVLDP